MNKNKVISILLASSVISSCIISSNVMVANADTINSKKIINTINDEVNKGVVLNSTFLKDEKGNVLGKSTSYDMLDIIKSYNDKYLVITQSGIKGYLNSSDFELINSGKNSKLENLDKVGKVSNVTTGLNLREDPSTNSNIIDTLPNNTMVHIKGKQGDWYKVSVNNKVGFVYGLFTDAKETKDKKIGSTTIDQAKKNIVGIKVQENKKQAYRDTFKRIIDETKAEKKAKKATVVIPKTATKANVSKATSKINKSDLEMYTSAKTGIVGINSGLLNLRSGASINDKEIGTLDKGSKLTILGHDGNWYLVRTENGQEGFVFGKYIKVNDNITKYSAPSHKVVKPAQEDHNVVKENKYNDLVKPVIHEQENNDAVKLDTNKKHDSAVKPTTDKGHDTVVTPSKTETKPVEKPQVTKPVNPVVINNAPVVKANNIVLVQGEKFTDAMLKATASDKEDGNLTGSIVYTGHVNTEVPGTYTIYLSVKDSQGAIAKTSAVVTVKAKVVKPAEKPSQSTKPEVVKPADKTQQTKPAEKPQPVVKPVELNNAPTIQGNDLTMTEGQKFSVDMLGLNAQDKEDGNLTANIKVLENTVNTAKAGKYQVVVKVTDKQGASCKRTFIVTVKAKPVAPSVINACPEITGHGVEIKQGTKFSVDMLGLKATDKEDGNLTDSIKVIENTVNTNEPGNYVVKVKVTDKQGSSMTKKFTVTVTKKVVEKTYNCKLEQSTEKGTSIKGTVKYKITYTDGSSDIFSCTGNGIDLPSKEIKNIEVYSAPRGYVAVNSEINTITQNNNTTTIGKFTFKEVYSNYDISIVQEYSDGSNVSGVKYEIFYNDGTSNIITDNQYSLKLEDKLVKDIKVVQLPEECSSYSMSKSESNIGDNVVKAEYQFIFKKKEHINIAPTITGKSITLIQGEKFNNSMLDVKANDQEDGNLTSKVKFEGTVDTAKVGTYEVTATVVDKNSAKATKTFTVKVVEEEAPVLNGKNITIAEGDKFDISMLGLTASDKEDGNITKDIKIVSNSVDVDKAGTYEVVASISDSFGKTTTQTFKVIVKAKPVVGWTADSKEFHNAVAQKMYSLVNAHRQAHGLKPLSVNQTLVNAADWKSKDMTDRHYFDHEDAQGKYTHDIPEFQDATSENIAQRTFDKTTSLTKADADKLATALFNQWKASPGHNAAMLDDTSSEMGFGFVLTDKGLVNATQEFNFYLG